jgi:type II secretory pathway pseudopilin PulG
VGTYQYPGDSDQPPAEHWNGTIWSIDNPLIPLGSTAVEISAVSVVSTDDVWIAGQYEGNYFSEYTVVEHWDGHRWSIAKTISPSIKYDQNFLCGVSALAGRTVWAVGTWDSAKNGYESLVERTSGKQWKIVHSPKSRNGYESILNSVDARSASSAWAVGYDAVTNVYGFPLTEYWNGQSWKIIPIFAPANATNAELTSVSTDGKETLALGYYQDGQPASGYVPLAEAWDGSKWNETSPIIPANSTSTDLRTVAFAGENSAWIVGGFSRGGNEPLIEQWNGKKWFISAT